MKMSLTKDFYKQPADHLAPLLLGKVLCRRIGEDIIRLPITETEAYVGEGDTACHARRGRTKRTDVMYEAGGISYVYLCYGIHHLLNIVTGRVDEPEAVLIRSVKGITGPGRLTKALQIDTALNREDLTRSDVLWLEEGAQLPYITTPRIGIDYADEEDRLRHWRFVVE